MQVKYLHIVRTVKNHSKTVKK